MMSTRTGPFSFRKDGTVDRWQRGLELKFVQVAAVRVQQRWDVSRRLLVQKFFIFVSSVIVEQWLLLLCFVCVLSWLLSLMLLLLFDCAL